MLPFVLTALLAQVQTPDAGQIEVLKPSGVRVIVVPRPEANTVAIAAGFRVGSAIDGAATCGTAHLLEHAILFRGTEFSTGDELIARWRELGGRLNGSTHPDYSVFRISVRREGVFTALEVLREMLFHPVFTQVDIQRESDVVVAELATREKDPLLQIYQLANQAIYGDHNYGLPGYGFPRTIKEIVSAALYARLDGEYTPGRLTLAVVGPVNENEVRYFLRETYGTYPSGGTTPPALAPLAPVGPNVRRLLTSTSPEAQAAFVFRGPPSADADWLPFEAMAYVLCGGERAKLREQLVHQSGIAKRLDLIVEPRVGGGLAVFRAVLEPQNLARCEREVKTTLARMFERSPDRDVIDRALNRLVLEAAQRAESPQNLATELVRWDVLGKWDYPLDLRRRLAQVPNERFGWIGQQYFAPNMYALAIIAPDGTYEAALGPAAGAVRRERRVLTAGGAFPIAAQSLPESNVYSFELAVRGGLAADPAAEEGLSALAARAVLYGEEGESGDAFRDKLLRWGVEIEAGAKRDVSYIRFSAPEGYFEDALESVTRAILDPAFRAVDIERARQDLLVETAGSPSIADAAERALWKHAMDGTPYAVVPPGANEALGALKSQDLASKVWKHWDRWWRPEHYAVAVCGPRHVEELVNGVQRAFTTAARQPPLEAGSADLVIPQHQPRTVVLDKEYRKNERWQAYLLFGWFVPESSPENLGALMLLREIMAGGPGSRLWRLRQDEGLVYHLQGKVVVARQVLCLQIAMVLPIENIRVARNLLLQELRRQVDDAELALARKAIERDAEERRERGLALVDEEAWFLLAGWDRDAYQSTLKAMGPATFRAKISQHCADNRLWTVAVGRREAVTIELGGRE